MGFFFLKQLVGRIYKNCTGVQRTVVHCAPHLCISHSGRPKRHQGPRTTCIVFFFVQDPQYMTRGSGDGLLVQSKDVSHEQKKALSHRNSFTACWRPSRPLSAAAGPSAGSVHGALEDQFGTALSQTELCGAEGTGGVEGVGPVGQRDVRPVFHRLL